MIARLVLFIVLSSSWFCASAQRNIDSLHRLGVCTPHGFTIPTIIGLPRSKGVEIYQERVPSYDLASGYAGTDSSFTNSVRRTKSWMAKLRVPVVNKDHFKMVVGLKYYQQEFAFDNPGSLDNSFHRSLQDKPIRSAGLSAYVIKSFIGNKYLAFRGTFRLNGDFEEGNVVSHQKTSAQVLYGIKHHWYKTWGFGLSYSNTFGRSSIYPVFFYRHKFRQKWAFETLLPISARLMYQPNEKNVFYFDNKLEGDNYNLNFDTGSNLPLYLEKADFKTFITYEREIYDFIWLGISGGYRININFDVSDSDAYFQRAFPIGNTNNLTISNSLGNALFFRFGLFLVPPRKWMDKDQGPKLK